MRPHGTRASRALGDTNNAARGEEDGVDEQLPGVGRDQMRSQRARDREFRCGRSEGALVIARSSASRRFSAPIGIRQRVGQFVPAQSRVRSPRSPTSPSCDGSPTTRRLAYVAIPTSANRRTRVAGSESVTATSPRWRRRRSRRGRTARAPARDSESVSGRCSGPSAVAAADRAVSAPRAHPRATHRRRPGRTRRRSRCGTAAVAVPVQSAVSGPGSALNVPRAL